MLLCGRYLLGTTAIAIHLEATIPYRELRAARRSWCGPGEVLCSGSVLWKTAAERGQTNFVGSTCLTGSVNQHGKQHTCAHTIHLPRTRSKNPPPARAKHCPQLSNGSTAARLAAWGWRPAGQVARAPLPSEETGIKREPCSLQVRLCPDICSRACELGPAGSWLLPLSFQTGLCGTSVSAGWNRKELQL